MLLHVNRTFAGNVCLLGAHVGSQYRYVVQVIWVKSRAPESPNQAFLPVPLNCHCVAGARAKKYLQTQEAPIFLKRKTLPKPSKGPYNCLKPGILTLGVSVG